MLFSFIHVIRGCRNDPRNVVELSQLSDRALDEIGSNRCDISRLAAEYCSG
jgi:uncharacterized protein YjiS (DUF1127 family)